MSTFETLYASLDADPKKRGHQFEIVCKWFLQNDPTYIDQLKAVWLWKEWPGRWTESDPGIDLVAENEDGTLWAIQAKAYEENTKIPPRDMNKFLSASGRAIFSTRMLISTTTRGLHHIAQENVSAQEKSVVIVDLNRLRGADDYLTWPESLDDLRPAPRPAKATPRAYQEKAIAAVIAGFTGHDRGQLLMACGTGKTLTALFVKEELRAQTVLNVSPSLSLLKQSMREWVTRRGEGFAVLPVCSDDTVRRSDDAAVHVSDLDLPATTDPVKIAEFLRRSGPKVIFATYQSSPDIAKAFTLGNVPSFDLIVADEAHRCAGKTSAFTTILDSVDIPAARRMFMTATPRVFTESAKTRADKAGVDYASMDDESKFGPVFHELSFRDAIDAGLLTDYRVVVVGVARGQIKTMLEEQTLVTTDGVRVESADVVARRVALAKTIRKYDLKRTLTFHSRIARAREFANSFPETVGWMDEKDRPVGTPWCKYATGSMSAGIRARLLQGLGEPLDGEYRILSNSKCLSEGVDVPTLDAVAFLDPRSSVIDIVQAVCRPMRNADGKNMATVIIPVFVDPGENPETVLESSEFNRIAEVVRALRSHDKELGLQIDEIQRRRKRPRRPDEELDDFPENFEFDFPVTIDRNFIEAFTTRLVQSCSSPWDVGIAEVRAYRDGKGDVLVPPSYVATNGHPTGKWVSRRREDYTAGNLSAARIAELESIDGWVWNAFDAEWNTNISNLRTFVAENGHTEVPWNHPLGPLSGWMLNCRKRRSVGELTPEQITDLQAIDGWTWSTTHAKWKANIAKLHTFAGGNGHTKVPGNTPLGKWVNRVRYTPGKLTPDQIAELESIDGWVWNVRDAKWSANITQLRAYFADNNPAEVPKNHPLRGWLNKCRASYAAGELSPKRTAELESIDGWAWNAFDAEWNTNISNLRTFVADTGKAEVPGGHPLGEWISMCRRRYDAGELTPERIVELESIDNCWLWRASP